MLHQAHARFRMRYLVMAPGTEVVRTDASGYAMSECCTWTVTGALAKRRGDVIIRGKCSTHNPRSSREIPWAESQLRKVSR